ncbi:hypothetical protein D9611_014510 [Ephemerocybe angulata]|uniref:Fungal-type protein kinase domain-containing protein n=1 Tax=Ephemerocybe angulata TaxID=980116 RepID=A0A8H5FET8_9AGAR|nr:hypothetical protein D9611_014510 [Tulosesus angulatus]
MDSSESEARIADAMAQDLRHCEAQIFITHYLPTPKEGLVDKVLDSLLADGVLKKTSRTNSTTDSNCFPNTYGDLSENSSGAFISKVPSHFERIIDVGERIREILVQEANLSRSGLSEPLESASCNPHPSQARPYGHPDRRFSFGKDVGDFKVDACLLDGVHCPHGSGSKLPTHRILVPLEVALKATEGDVRQNREKLFAAVNSIMNGDARRDFVYGITNEDDRVFLWYFSRTHSVKTSSFSLVKNPDQLVRVLVSLLSASDEDLGLNPNIALYPEKHPNPGYIYRFPGDSAGSSRFFKTTGVVQEASSERLSSGTTRVWKAVEVANFEGDELVPNVAPKEVIIKDVWIDAKAETEKEIQEKVFKSIDDFIEGSQSWRDHPCLAEFEPSQLSDLETLVANKMYRDRFLRVRQDHQSGMRPVSITPIKTQRIQSKYQRTKTSQTVPTGQGDTDADTSRKIHAEFTPKKRCFFFFDDVCTRVSHVPSLGDAMTVLRQTSTVLLLMFCAGWVHRDISTGNILAIEEANTGWSLQLADLEYAKPFPSPGKKATGNWTTGTPYFMATELQLGSYITMPVHVAGKALADDSDSDSDDGDGDESVEMSGNSRLQDVVHNLQHDLESLWWIGFYLTTMKTGHRKSYYWCISKKIFQDRLERRTNSHRHQLLLDPESFPKSLRRSFHPALSDLVRVWRRLSTNFKPEYEKRSLGDVTDKSTYANLAWQFVLFFDALEKSREEWGPIPLMEAADESKKRGREEDDAGEAKGVNPGSDQQEDTDAGPSVKRPRVATSTPLQDNEEGGDLFDILIAGPTYGPGKRSKQGSPSDKWLLRASYPVL